MWERRPDGSFAQTVAGLRADLRPDPAAPPRYEVVFDQVIEARACVATVDSARRPAVRDRWHWRFDVPAASVRHWHAVAAAAVPPLLWLGAYGRRAMVRRRRVRLSLCWRCGYDLRGSAAGVCPECGATAAGELP